MNIKKILAFISALTICTAASFSCSSKSSSSSDTSSETSETQDASGDTETSSDTEEDTSVTESEEDSSEASSENISSSEAASDAKVPSTSADTTGSASSEQTTTSSTTAPVVIEDATYPSEAVFEPVGMDDVEMNVDDDGALLSVPFQNVDAGEVTDEDEIEELPAKSGTIKKVYSLWMDIKDGVDYYFEGEFITMTFKVKDDAKGDYEISLDPDLSDVMGVSPNKSTSVRSGTVRVGEGSIDPLSISDLSGMTIYGENIACSAGDTIEYHVNIKENKGLAAVMLWTRYDSDAFEFISAKPCGEFESIAVRAGIASGHPNS